MASLSDFADFVKSTAPAWASSQDAFVNEIQQNSYPLARFLKGRDMADVFQNGERIKDGIILDQPGTFQMISPETESTWTNAQTLTTWEIPWRFAQAHMSWTAQEVELNGPLRQPDVDGGGGNQQDGKDRQHAVPGYPSQTPQPDPVSIA